MAAEIDKLLIALKEWRKAIAQLKHQGKSLEARERQLEQAKQKVLACLSSAAIAAEIDDLIQQAQAPQSYSTAAVRQTLIQEPEPLLSQELETMRPLSVSRAKLDKLTTVFLQTPDEEQPLDNSEQLKKIFLILSETIPEAYQDSIELSRKPKKRRRRDLALGALQTILGLGLIAGNTQLDSAIASASYILGGNALLSALQNLVGPLDEDKG